MERYMIVPQTPSSNSEWTVALQLDLEPHTWRRWTTEVVGARRSCTSSILYCAENPRQWTIVGAQSSQQDSDANIQTAIPPDSSSERLQKIAYGHPQNSLQRRQACTGTMERPKVPIPKGIARSTMGIWRGGRSLIVPLPLPGSRDMPQKKTVEFWRWNRRI